SPRPEERPISAARLTRRDESWTMRALAALGSAPTARPIWEIGMPQVGWRFWLETALGSLSALLFVLTLVWRDWIELVFGLDPDAGSGAVEWLVVAVTAAASVAFFVSARLEWRRAQLQATSSTR